MNTTAHIADPRTRRLAEDAEHLARFDSYMHDALVQALVEDDARIVLGVVSAMIPHTQRVELGRDLPQTAEASRFWSLSRRAARLMTELVAMLDSTNSGAQPALYLSGTGADTQTARRIERTLRELVAC
jgi:hypothetical protein